ncbi:MAG TPA: MFS transporter, partial [Fimbriimonadaceae bacterium]|nr:MFS transporter [Fimbriimonadaceae bacterium]
MKARAVNSFSAPAKAAACRHDPMSTVGVQNQPDLKALPRRPVVLRLLIIALLAEIGYAVLNISTMPIYLKFDRNMGAGSIGLVLSAFLLSEAVFKSPMGHLADRYGRRVLMTAGPLLTFCTALLSLAVPHDSGGWEVLAFVLLRVLDGIGAAMLWPAAFAAMGDSVADDERQQAMSLLNMCYLLGVALALPIGGLVNDVSGAKWASLLLAAALFGGVGYASWKFVPRIARPQHTAPDEMPIEGEVDVSLLIKSA